MYKKLVKAAVLLLVFVLSVIGLSLLNNSDNIDLTIEMPKATLPVVILKDEGISINELYGYTGEMDPLTMRDTITPVPENLLLPIEIQTYQQQVDAISYTVRTLDMKRLLEETKVTGYAQKDGVLEAELKIQNLLEAEQEYLLTIELESGDATIQYYTRLILSKDYKIKESLEFVMDFHNKALEKEQSAELATYLEPNSDGDNTTLQRVTIHSSLNQVAWGDFNGERLQQPVPSIKEAGSSYNTIVLNYVMGATGENGELEYYNVEELFQVRYSAANARMHLLDYERTMHEIFRENGNHFGGSDIKLGIRDLDVKYMANESGSTICFIQEGELWGYNSNSNQLSLIFSFRGTEGINSRENNPNHEIRLIKVDEAGSADFVVYGYMNRGKHEGRTGVGVYHYDSVANTIEEVLFLHSDKAYQVLKEDWGRLFYVSDDNIFYMLGADTLYRVNLEEGKTIKLYTGLADENYAVSENGRYIAWREKDQENLITVTDLEGEKKWQITGEKNVILRPIGFIENDFVYGIARIEEITNDLFPMYKMIIIDEAQNIVKEYEKAGYYVSHAYVENDTVFLERVFKNGDIFENTGEDALKSHDVEASQKIRVETETVNEKQTQVKLITNQQAAENKPKVLTPKEVVAAKKHDIELVTETVQNRYYVYAAGKVILCTNMIDMAIRRADESAGVVIGKNQQYVWRRGKAVSSSVADKVIIGEAEIAAMERPEARCLTAMLQNEGINLDVSGLINQGEQPLDILQEAMSEKDVLNLTGCTLNQILYYVGLQTAVYAMGEGNQPLLIVGYDEYNVVIYDPATNTTYKKGKQDSETYFSSGGNVFIGYMR